MFNNKPKTNNNNNRNNNRNFRNNNNRNRNAGNPNEKNPNEKNSMETEIKKFDLQNMFQLLQNYWKDIKIAVENAKKSEITFEVPKKKTTAKTTKATTAASKTKQSFELLILGIGGSAMSGELLKSYLKYLIGTQDLKITISRGWEIPDDISAKTCVFVCSYSGNTEETLLALEKVQAKSKNIIGVTSGGKLAEKCSENKFPILELPKNLMPRCAMSYSFFHILFVILRQGLISKEATEILENSIREILETNINPNKAVELAQKMKNKIPIIYTAQARLEAVNLRWKAQIQENANQICFGNFFPELNHNEINGWTIPSDLADRFFFISMTDKDDSEELNNLIKKSMLLLKNNGMNVMNIAIDAKFLLTRIYLLFWLGDWTSFYLAILNQVDPTPIPEISKLKEMK
jgi:glucose/mannose-6-phosphate isomerase